MVSSAVDKLDEEIGELKEILPRDGEKPTPSQKAAIEKELGGVLRLVNVARKLDIDSEKATLTTVHKFRSRFGFY